MQSIETKDELELDSDLNKSETRSLTSNLQAEKREKQFTFEDLKLKVGDQLQIRLSMQEKGACRPENGRYYLTNLIGYFQGRSLLSSIPQSTQLAGCPLVENDKLDVFFFNGKTLFKFSSFVDKIISLPFKYMHLSFPDQISGQIIRKSKRTSVCINAIIKNPKILVKISDISMTGAKIQSSSDIGKLSDSIEIALKQTSKNL
ncbi:flagellar brake protein [Nitrosomonas sp.]|uniref:flagellar brake protein n=1 Tax=Nitrosomonas sp. TaxID=42353 RepID=UPI00283D0238|nr:flagellar brake protein [Nitrosomonas sp.]MDR4514906.1 flagellar brake protein [Nitrosomonas sp.]